MKSKQYVLYFLSITISLLSFFILFNYFIDPYMMFSHKNIFNTKQVGANERQQKTNYLKFVIPSQSIHFNSVLLGSSRTTYINQNDFNKFSVYNYAANNMVPQEYMKFIDYFSDITENVPKTIILGIDFFGTNKTIATPYIHEDYLSQTEIFAYRWKTLSNIKLIEYSARNIKQIFKTKKPYYNRDNIKFPPNIEFHPLKTSAGIKSTLLKLDNYQYNASLKNLYIKLKQKYNKSQFIIFTSPVTINQLNYYKKNNLMPYYFKWLEELVEVFGEVNHFMYPNTITEDLNNFFDSTHILPQTGKYIADYISYKKRYKDFGLTLTKDNINQFKEERYLK